MTKKANESRAAHYLDTVGVAGSNPAPRTTFQMREMLVKSGEFLIFQRKNKLPLLRSITHGKPAFTHGKPPQTATA